MGLFMEFKLPGWNGYLANDILTLLFSAFTQYIPSLLLVQFDVMFKPVQPLRGQGRLGLIGVTKCMLKPYVQRKQTRLCSGIQCSEVHLLTTFENLHGSKSCDL